jgi:predicted DNA binding protein
MPTKLEVSLYHHGDWTTLTEGFRRVTLESVEVFCDPLQDRNVEAMIVYGKKDDIRTLFERIQKPEGNVRVLKILRIDEGIRGVYLRGSYMASVRKHFFENSSIVKKLIIERGEERFSALVFEDRTVERLIKGLSSVAQISKLNTRWIDMEQLVRSPEAVFTPFERRVIKCAYEQGFFEKPRRTDLATMSKIFNLSKSTMDYHVKKIVRKLLSKELETHIV